MSISDAMSRATKRPVDETSTDEPHRAKRRRRRPTTRPDETEHEKVQSKASLQDAPEVEDFQPPNESTTVGTAGLSTDSAVGSDVTRRKSRSKSMTDLDIVPTRDPDAKVEADPPADSQELPTSPKLEKKRGNGSKRKSRDTLLGARTQKENTWLMTEPAGGTFINVDPSLTPDGQHVILATKANIQIYAAKTSLLIRTIHLERPSAIVDCVLSKTDSKVVFLATANGHIFSYDWTTGKRLGLWRTNCQPKNIHLLTTDEEHSEILAPVLRDGQACSLQHIALSHEGSDVVATPLLQQASLQHGIYTFDKGEVVVACGREEVFVGQRRAAASLHYDWKQLNIPNRITAIDVRLNESRGKGTKLANISIALATQTGAILVYDDILNRLVMKESGAQNIDVKGRRLHWHRTGPRAVKWSRDGNYLISGGDESVLVIWQLDTEQRQYLPHLSTSILNITISDTGAQYVLRLGDNSVMVLATADLSPSTNIVGLGYAGDRGTTGPTLLHPKDSNRLLAAIPARSIGATATNNASHLQIYDIDANLQLSRQAMTRNLTTIVNVGPNAQPLQEPDVTQMGMTSDGRWLATVDEWTPEPADLRAGYLEDDQEKQNLHETVLRFWKWDVEGDGWESVTRVDQPHTPSLFSLLSMTQHPKKPQFATMGADGYLKIWEPRMRVRDGVIVKDSSGQPLYSWNCHRSYQIEQDYTDTAASSIVSGTLAYSEDGSVIVASWSTVAQDQRNTHFINADTGVVCLTQPHLLTRGPATLSFAGRNLVALSEKLVIFDTVTVQTTYSLTLDPKFTSPSADYEEPNKFLAINPRSNTFAMAINPTKNYKEHAQLCIFNLDDPGEHTLADFSVPNRVRALLAEPQGMGFVLVDGDARVRRLRPNVHDMALSGARQQQLLLPQKEMQLQKGFEDIFGGRQHESATSSVLPRRTLAIEEGAAGHGDGDRILSLEDLLHVPSTAAQPDVHQLFARVAKAVGGIGVAA